MATASTGLRRWGSGMSSRSATHAFVSSDPIDDRARSIGTDERRLRSEQTGAPVHRLQLDQAPAALAGAVAPPARGHCAVRRKRVARSDGAGPGRQGAVVLAGPVAAS